MCQLGLGFYKMKQTTIEYCYESAFDLQILEAFASRETYDPKLAVVALVAENLFLKVKVIERKC